MALNIHVTADNVTKALARNGKNPGTLLLVMFSGDNPVQDYLSADAVTGGMISRRIKREEFDAANKSARTIDTDLSVSGLDQVVLVGAGSRAKATLESLRATMIQAFGEARNGGAENIVMPVIDADLPHVTVEQFAHLTAECAALVDYEPNHQKTRPWHGEKEQSHFKSLRLVCAGEALAAAKAGVSLGRKFADATNDARNWVNEPSSTLTPAKLARIARQIARDSGGQITCKVLGRAEIKRLGMGGLLAVNAGSKNAPVFIDMRYDPASGASDEILGLVGKGITFDSGGLGIKDGEGMKDMKDDMGGAAAVLAAMSLLSTLKPNVSVRAVVAATENLVDARSFRPGDVLKTMSGLTVEVGHTDCEGRLILADALHYVQIVCKATQLVDLATLTGAVEDALGNLISGVFSNNKRFAAKFLASAKAAGEPMYELPLAEDYREGNKSEMADLTNDGTGPGAIIAAWFLCEFVQKGIDWVHVDIGGTAFRQEAHGANPVGASGVGVRTLARLLMSY